MLICFNDEIFDERYNRIPRCASPLSGLRVACRVPSADVSARLLSGLHLNTSPLQIVDAISISFRSFYSLFSNVSLGDNAAKRFNVSDAFRKISLERVSVALSSLMS